MLKAVLDAMARARSPHARAGSSASRRRAARPAQRCRLSFDFPDLGCRLALGAICRRARSAETRSLSTIVSAATLMGRLVWRQPATAASSGFLSIDGIALSTPRPNIDPNLIANHVALIRNEQEDEKEWLGFRSRSWVAAASGVATNGAPVATARWSHGRVRSVAARTGTERGKA